MTQELNKKKPSVSETLKTSFHLWKENFILIAIVITLVFIPVQILIECTSILFEHFREPNYLENLDDWRRFVDEARIYDLIRQIIGVIATLGIFNYVYSILRKEDNNQNAYEIVRYGVKRWPTNFVENFLAGLIILCYTLLLIIPGIYKAVQYAFIPNLVSDNESEPLEKSKLLVKNNWFDILWILILMFLIGLAIELALIVPFMFLPESFITTVIFGVLAAIGSSYTIVIKGVYYFNLKKLKLAPIEVESNSESV
jgi:hypothetical protein